MRAVEGLKRLGAGNERDLGGRAWAVATWVACIMALAVGFASASTRPLLWTVGFTVSGALCLVNAIRSGRFHCAFTGPTFLVGAALTVARALGWVSLSWMALGVGVVGAVGTAVLVEVVSGKRRFGSCC